MEKKRCDAERILGELEPVLHQGGDVALVAMLDEQYGPRLTNPPHWRKPYRRWEMPDGSTIESSTCTGRVWAYWWVRAGPGYVPSQSAIRLALAQHGGEIDAVSNESDIELGSLKGNPVIDVEASE